MAFSLFKYSPLKLSIVLILGVIGLYSCLSFSNSPAPENENPKVEDLLLELHGKEGMSGIEGGRNWADELLSEDRKTKKKVFQDLLELKTKAIPILEILFLHPEESVRESAQDLFTRMGEEAIPSLLKLLDSNVGIQRYHAICCFRDMGPQAEKAVSALGECLDDAEIANAMEAARALAQLREKAAPAVEQLAKALEHPHWIVRVMAAGALSSIGPKSAPAIRPLIILLIDEDVSVRRAAADALAAIGQEAWPATDALIASLKDENLYVRICAAGALGSIGPKAKAALEELNKALKDPGLNSEATWAIARIQGKPVKNIEGLQQSDSSLNVEASQIFQPKDGQWLMFCGNARRNAVSSETGLPETWDLETGKNLLWSVRLGTEMYGSPIVTKDKVYIGSDNTIQLGTDLDIQAGTLFALDKATGKLIWKDLAPRLGRGLEDFLLDTTTSSPLIEGERLYYITAQAQLRCLDTEGFRDKENDGPIKDEVFISKVDADLIWELDFGSQLGVYPHEAPNCSVVSVGNLLMVCTSNGVDEAHKNVPAPRAPSFLGVDKRNGKVVWKVIGPSPNVFHGQWSSPSLAVVRGKVVAFFGGGDGWLYALDSKTGDEIWRLDGNPEGSVWRTGSDIKGGKLQKNNIIASPLYDQGVVYLAMGQDPEHGLGQGRLLAIDPQGSGDVTKKRVLWSQDKVGRSLTTPIAHEGLIYMADLNGEVHCIDQKTGKIQWSHDLLARIWSSIFVADGRLYVGDEDGTVTVFKLGKEKKILARNEVYSTAWAAPCAAEGVLYFPTASSLYAFKVKEPKKKSE